MKPKFSSAIDLLCYSLPNASMGNHHGEECFVQGLMRSEGPMLIRQEHCRSILDVLCALTQSTKKNMAVKLFQNSFELIKISLTNRNVTQLVFLKILLDLTIS